MTPAQTLALLYEVAEALEIYSDIRDGDYDGPVPNEAMRALQKVDAAIEELEEMK